MSADPHGVPNDDHGLRACPIVLKSKVAPHDRMLAKEAERVRGNERASEMLSRMPLDCDIHAGARVRREAAERSRSLLPVEEIQVRHATGASLCITGGGVHDAIGLVYRQVLQIPAIDDGEHSSVLTPMPRAGANTTAAVNPRCLTSSLAAKILLQRLDRVQSAGFPVLLFE
jgi:hypothetical protein